MTSLYVLLDISKIPLVSCASTNLFNDRYVPQTSENPAIWLYFKDWETSEFLLRSLASSSEFLSDSFGSIPLDLALSLWRGDLTFPFQNRVSADTPSGELIVYDFVTDKLEILDSNFLDSPIDYLHPPFGKHKFLLQSGTNRPIGVEVPNWWNSEDQSHGRIAPTDPRILVTESEFWLVCLNSRIEKWESDHSS